MIARIKGFTLVELLVVISIVGLLTAILLPCLGTVREKARQVVCLAHLRTIGQALYIYAHDNDDRLVPGDSGIPWMVWGPKTEGEGVADTRSQVLNLGHLLHARSLEDHSVLFCPSERAVYVNPPAETFLESWSRPKATASITYMFNEALDGFGAFLQNGEDTALSHKNRINFLRADGSTYRFDVKPLAFSDTCGPELLPEAVARQGICFPTVMVHTWLEHGAIDLPEARAFLDNPAKWVESRACVSSARPVIMATLGSRSLVCDAVGYVRNTAVRVPAAKAEPG